jgi:serine/threonine-protein kinase
VLLGGTKLREVEFVLFDKETLEIYIEELNGVFLGDAEQAEETLVDGPGRDDALDETIEITAITRPIIGGR